MKILLVHPEDSIEAHARSGNRWDYVVDLGWSGRDVYSQLTEELGFRVFSIHDVLDHELHRARMREVLSVGLGQVLDADALDWWDIFSAYPYQRLEQIMVLSALADQIAAGTEIVVTRPDFAAHALALLLNCELRALTQAQPIGIGQTSRRYLKAAATLRPSQLIEIAFDKWDTDYNLRRRFNRASPNSPTPAVLLPSAYANVSRAQIAYARMLPHRRFLLVVTRNNGIIPNLPANVEMRSLASYAQSSSTFVNDEYRDLMERWQNLQEGLFQENIVLRVAHKLNIFDGFSKFLKSGMRVRDAWREVFAREPITTVLSADENNCYTRMPIQLARSKRLPTVFCDHGALNMSLGVRISCSDTYLMRNAMAQDYSTRFCRMDPHRLVLGGPQQTNERSQFLDRTKSASERDCIVFYSEAYELSSSRTRTLYGELLPELCALAAQTKRRIMIKFHPFESLKARKAIVDEVLGAEQRQLVEFREGPMTPNLFESAWFSIMVESSVAVESTINGIPCFLCSWFDSSWYEYGKQYARFSAGHQLDSPRRIREIPQLLEQIRITEATRRGLQTAISPENLDSLLFGS
jgi:hypothetical protein